MACSARPHMLFSSHQPNCDGSNSSGVTQQLEVSQSHSGLNEHCIRSCARRCATAVWPCWRHWDLRRRPTSPARGPSRTPLTTCATPSARTVRPSQAILALCHTPSPEPAPSHYRLHTMLLMPSQMCSRCQMMLICSVASAFARGNLQFETASM